MKRKYEQAMEKHDEKMKYDYQQIDKLSVEKKLAHENEKQKVKFILHLVIIRARFLLRLVNQ